MQETERVVATGDSDDQTRLGTEQPLGCQESPDADEQRFVHKMT